jgi:phage replication-related protein YjqB (UPF0714/DUF867 family)
MEVMLWFEDIGESTSTLPFLTNSKVGMVGFVNLHKMAPIKNSFSHLHSAQNGGQSSYFHLVQQLHIAISMHGHSKKTKATNILCLCSFIVYSRSKKNLYKKEKE